MKPVPGHWIPPWTSLRMPWAGDEIDDQDLVVQGRYTILTILHTLINAPDRRENTLRLLRKLQTKGER